MKRNITIKRAVGAGVLTKFLRSILTFSIVASCTISAAQDLAAISDSSSFVTGVVRDANTKQPLAAVQILALNHEAAATSNENGTFSIKIASSSEVIIVKAFDYNTREIAVRGRTHIEIDLYPNEFSNAYGKLESITGTVSSSFYNGAGNAIDNFDHTTAFSADNAIQSKLNGDLRAISRSGLNGIGSSLFIRGLNSINRNAQPLFIVDGVIWNSLYDVTSVHDGYFTNTLDNIDLNDIENVTVVKDATSIYGSKGANGVVIINTKRGKDMVTKIDVDAVGGITSVPESLPTMDGDQFRIYATDLMGSMTDNQILEQFGNTVDNLSFLQDNPAKIQNYNQYHNVTNWDKEVYNTGKSQTYHIGVNGGDEKALYFFSLGYSSIQGVVKTTDMQRLNMRFNADIDMSKRLKMGLSVGYSTIDRVLLDDGANFYTSPTFLAMTKSPILNPYTYTISGTQSTDMEDSDIFNIGNPTALIDNALNTNKQYRLTLGAKPSYKISPSLSLSSRFEYSLDKVKETYYSPILGVANRYVPGYGISENVFRSQQMRDVSLFNDARLQYNSQFNSLHRVNAILGMRYISDYYESDYGEGHNSGSDQKRNLLTEEDYRQTTGLNNRSKSISNYTNIDYSFDNRYFLTASVAVDGSSRFGNETQGGFQMMGRSWGAFPSINAAWLISSEKFMSGIGFVDRLKLRVGYGFSGNDDINPYANTAYFTSVRYMNRANGLTLANIGNNEIQWETTEKMSVGIDMNILNDRVGLSADVYNNNTQDLLSLRELPETAGSGYYWSNGGELSNKGYEVSLNIKALNTSFLKWELGASIGHYLNKIKSLPQGNYTTSVYGGEVLTSVGNAAGVFYGYKTSGVYATDADAVTDNFKVIDSKGYSHYFTAGDMRFEDFTSDGIINEKDKQIIGDPNPDFYGSFTSKMMIKGFTIDALFTYSYGNDVYNYMRSQLESGKNFSNQTTAMLNRWVGEGQLSNMPKATYGDPMGNARFSDRWIEDGSFLKLKSLTVNYKVPLKGNAIKSLNVWISANNIWTLSKYLGRDPEVSVQNDVLYQGVDNGLLPACKSYFVGIKFSL